LAALLVTRDNHPKLVDVRFFYGEKGCVYGSTSLPFCWKHTETSLF
jgi:hypothetical protein